MARRMRVSYSGPREDVSLKALGGYAPLALQTDILPRSIIGESYRLHLQKILILIREKRVRKLAYF